MTTSVEFNKKYNKWLESGHTGLTINDEHIVGYLDHHFEHFTQYPNFMFAQIKTKFSSVRFYCKGLPESLVHEVERTIKDYLTVKHHGKF